jgi:hypothetical protein
VKREHIPKGFRAQKAADAKHWLTYELARIGDMVASKPSEVIACGKAIDLDSFQRRTTKIPRDATCWECAKRARAMGYQINVQSQEMF